MTTQRKTIKIHAHSHQQLSAISAETGLSMSAIINDLACSLFINRDSLQLIKVRAGQVNLKGCLDAGIDVKNREADKEFAFRKMQKELLQMSAK